MRIYSVYDRVAQEYSAPNVCVNDGVAYRQFQGLMAKVPPYSQADYILVRLGEMDMSSGLITPLECAVQVETLDGADKE